MIFFYNITPFCITLIIPYIPLLLIVVLTALSFSGLSVRLIVSVVFGLTPIGVNVPLELNGVPIGCALRDAEACMPL